MSADSVRLSINLAPDVASVLRRLTGRKGISTTEGIRRAIAIWNFVETEMAAGNRLAALERDGRGERVREIAIPSPGAWSS